MSRTLDFNAIEKPTLDVTMRDEERTVLHLSVPSVDFVEKIQALEPTIKKIKSGGGLAELRETVKKFYGFFAEVMSHNEDCMKVTAEDLRDVYKLNLVDLLQFYSAYNAFIEDIKNAKN
jgi:hypothetical protein